MAGTVVKGDNLTFLKTLADESVQLIYVDPPFNTGNVQRMRRVKSSKTATGTKGFGGEKYTHQVLSDMAYADAHSDYITSHLAPRLIEAHRLLATDGTLYLHLDMREVHYAKVFLDGLFGRECFLNEIIWSYDFGGRGKRCWPKKHDNILVYVKDPERYTFNYNDVDRIPYMAPDLAGAAKAARGKFPTDVWWQTIVPTNGKERTGYPTQKPIQLARRIVTASSDAGRTVLDFYAGSGTVGEASEQLRRDWILCDSSDTAVAVMQKRFARVIPGANITWTSVQAGLNQDDQEEQQAANG